MNQNFTIAGDFNIIECIPQNQSHCCNCTTSVLELVLFACTCDSRCIVQCKAYLFLRYLISTYMYHVNVMFLCIYTMVCVIAFIFSSRVFMYISPGNSQSYLFPVFLNFVHFDETSINHIILQFIFRYFTQFTFCVLNPYVCYFNTKDVNFCLECFYLVFPIDDYGSKLIHSHTELIQNQWILSHYFTLLQLLHCLDTII